METGKCLPEGLLFQGDTGLVEFPTRKELQMTVTKILDLSYADVHGYRNVFALFFKINGM